MAEAEIVIAPARGDEDIAIVHDLFLEYADWLDFDLCFQGFEAELKALQTQLSKLLKLLLTRLKPWWTASNSLPQHFRVLTQKRRCPAGRRLFLCLIEDEETSRRFVARWSSSADPSAEPLHKTHHRAPAQ